MGMRVYSCNIGYQPIETRSNALSYSSGFYLNSFIAQSWCILSVQYLSIDITQHEAILKNAFSRPRYRCYHKLCCTFFSYTEWGPYVGWSYIGGAVCWTYWFPRGSYMSYRNPPLGWGRTMGSQGGLWGLHMHAHWLLLLFFAIKSTNFVKFWLFP